ncbi:MAG: UPF0262 family protein [Rhodospirillales bacterium]|nr:UPF0262 family protein [Rhodospirillales bacterium]
MPDPHPPHGPAHATHPDRHHIAHPTARLSRVLLDGEALTRLSPILEADRAQAVADLEAENRFAPIAATTGIAGLRDADIGAGPFVLHLSIQEGRLVFDIRRDDDARLGTLALALGPFRRLIKDYQMLVDSHVKAVEEGREARIQAIDMGRRGLHDEGAHLLAGRLAGRIAIDFATARRLFTLVCVLHQRM